MNNTIKQAKYPRYESYKDSGIEWIGKIPEGWEVKKVKYTTFVKARIGWQNLRSDEFSDEGILCITGIDFKKGLIDFKNAYRVSKERYDQDPYIQLNENDLLITKDGTIGKIAFVKNLEEPATLNSGVFVTRPSKQKYLQKFMFWVLNSEVFFKFFDYQANGTTINHLYQNTFVELPYPLPSAQTQERIAEFLDEKTDKIDTLMRKNKKLVELLKERRQALISHVVTKGLDPNAKMKDSGIEWFGQIPEGWEVQRIGNIFEFRNTKVSVKDYRPLSVTYQGTIPQVKTAALSVHDDNRKLVKEGDIAINGRSDRKGAAGIANEDGSVSVVYHVLKPREKITGKYYHYLLRSEIFSQEFFKWGRGIVDDLWTTRSEEMKKIYVPLPLQQIQKQIAEYLDTETEKIDSAINKIKRQNELLKEYRQSLISSAVTGKIKV